jgi:hypothetical protein
MTKEIRMTKSEANLPFDAPALWVVGNPLRKLCHFGFDIFSSFGILHSSFQQPGSFCFNPKA